MANRWGKKMETVTDFIFLGSKNHCRQWLQPWNSKTLAPWKKSYDQLRQLLKSRGITLLTKVHIVKAMVFPVVMYGCEGWITKRTDWVLKSRCLWTVVLEKTLESPLDFKEIKPINPEGNQPLIFIGRTVGWSWSSNSLATWCEELTHWKGPWSWERLRAGGKGSDRGWDV